MNDFWLSHHREGELNRTYRVGSLHVCARCLGTYPALLASIFLQFVLKAPLASAYDGFLALGLPLPALVDWSHGRFRPLSGTNAYRTASGMLLGAGLGRTLFVHIQQPLPFWLLAQMGMILAVAIPVIALTYRQSGGGRSS